MHLPPWAKAALTLETMMFRISFEQGSTGLTMRIEGRLAGHFADEARQLVALRNQPARLVVDLSDVTFADAAGENALLWLSAIGGKFVANTLYSLHLCDRLHLPHSNGKARDIPTLSSP